MVPWGVSRRCVRVLDYQRPKGTAYEKPSVWEAKCPASSRPTRAPTMWWTSCAITSENDARSVIRMPPRGAKIWRGPTSTTRRDTPRQGEGRKKIPPGGEFFSSNAKLGTPQTRIQKFLPAGDFFYPNPPLSHNPPPPEPPPPRPPRCPPPNPTPPPLLRRPRNNFVEAAPATMARRGQSHAPDRGPDSRSPGVQAQQHQLSHGLFTCICTGAH